MLLLPGDRREGVCIEESGVGLGGWMYMYCYLSDMSESPGGWEVTQMPAEKKTAKKSQIQDDLCVCGGGGVIVEGRALDTDPP